MTRAAYPLSWWTLVLACGSASIPLGCTPPAEAMEQDKAKHVAVSAAIGAAVKVANPGMSDLEATGWALLPGLAKEAYDARRGGSGFSFEDLAADAVGAYLGVRGAGWVLELRRDEARLVYRAEF